MNKIFKRIFSFPVIAIELIITSFGANFFALIPAIFVILVLQKYLSYGVDETLITLASGTIIAIILEYIFRRLRYQIVRKLNNKFDYQIDNQVFTTAISSKLTFLGQIPVSTIRGVFSSPEQIRQIYSAANICAFLDAPFAIIFIIALYFISPLICYFTVAITLVLSFAVLTQLIGLRVLGRELNKENNAKIQLSNNVIATPDTIRVFDCSGYLQKKWELITNSLLSLHSRILDRQNSVQTAIKAAAGLLTVVVISTGAVLVVTQQLDVGSMIGANILAARVFAPIVAVFQQADGWIKAEHASQTVSDFVRLPLEKTDGTALTSYTGSIEFKDVSYNYPAATNILIESLNFTVKAGEVLFISGKNGSGKTTLAKIITGLIEPVSGYLSIDGINMKQISLDWWRTQIIYLPQEPGFFDGTIRDNFLAYKNNLNIGEIRKLLASVGLVDLVDKTIGGLDQFINGGGTTISLGVRRRIALARALSYDGQLVVLDEPTEGIDSLGATHVYKIMTELSRRGKTVIVCSHDREIMKGAHHFIDLDEKPSPIMKTIKI